MVHGSQNKAFDAWRDQSGRFDWVDQDGCGGSRQVGGSDGHESLGTCGADWSWFNSCQLSISGGILNQLISYAESQLVDLSNQARLINDQQNKVREYLTFLNDLREKQNFH